MCNYQVFELKREKEKEDGGKGIEGGGVAIGALHELNPVLTRQGDDDTECLSVDRQKFLCVAGYGPQMGDKQERKTKFWKYLDEDAKSASDRDLGLTIQMGTNSWAGPNIIPKDPNNQNINGKYLQKFLEENPALTVVNSLACCEGVVTRQRITTLHYAKKEAFIFEIRLPAKASL